jgi:hypothetical protein
LRHVGDARRKADLYVLENIGSVVIAVLADDGVVDAAEAGQEDIGIVAVSSLLDGRSGCDRGSTL